MEKFSYEENGYNRKEVNDFVSHVITETESIVKKVKEQQEEIKKLQEEIEKYKQSENQIKDALLQSEKVGENIRKMAQDEKELIIKNAKESASKIINDALIRTEKIVAERLLLEKNMRQVKRKIKLIIEEQQELLEEINQIKIEKE